jgi:hypothetical protein
MCCSASMVINATAVSTPLSHLSITVPLLLKSGTNPLRDHLLLVLCGERKLPQTTTRATRPETGNGVLAVAEVLPYPISLCNCKPMLLPFIGSTELHSSTASLPYEHYRHYGHDRLESTIPKLKALCDLGHSRSFLVLLSYTTNGTGMGDFPVLEYAWGHRSAVEEKRYEQDSTSRSAGGRHRFRPPGRETRALLKARTRWRAPPASRGSVGLLRDLVSRIPSY